MGTIITTQLRVSMDLSAVLAFQFEVIRDSRPRRRSARAHRQPQRLPSVSLRALSRCGCAHIDSNHSLSTATALHFPLTKHPRPGHAMGVVVTRRNMTSAHLRCARDAAGRWAQYFGVRNVFGIRNQSNLHFVWFLAKNTQPSIAVFIKGCLFSYPILFS